MNMIHALSAAWSICYIFFSECLVYGWRRKVEAGLKKYKTNIIISVHPIMQLIPLWVLKCQGLPNRVVFVTVITDLNTCHPTWYIQLMIRKTYSKAIFHLIWQLEEKKRRFHADVNSYCPSEEVAKRSALDDLQPSQIRVFGLPRPSFCLAVLVKVFSSP